MLTLKLISEETERVIRGLNKKHFKGAEEAINEPCRSKEDGSPNRYSYETGQQRRG